MSPGKENDTGVVGLSKTSYLHQGCRPFLFTRKKRGNPTKVIVWPWKDYGLPERPQLFRTMIRWLLSEIDGGPNREIGSLFV